MKKFLIMVILTMASIPLKAEELRSKDINLMKNIVRNCLETPVLGFPRPKMDVDRELNDFEAYKRWFMRDMKKLEASNQNALDSTHVIKRKPFVEHMASCKELISTTSSKLAKAKSMKPSNQAQKKINTAIWQCQTASQWIDDPEKFNANFDSISTYYDYYTNSLKEAERLDSRAVSWRKEEIRQCNEVFVPKYLALNKQKQQKQQEKDVKRALVGTRIQDHQREDGSAEWIVSVLPEMEGQWQKLRSVGTRDNALNQVESSCVVKLWGGHFAVKISQLKSSNAEVFNCEKVNKAVRERESAETEQNKKEKKKEQIALW